MKDLTLTITIPGSEIQDIIEYAQADNRKLSYKAVAEQYKEYFDSEQWQCNLEDMNQFVKEALELE